MSKPAPHTVKDAVIHREVDWLKTLGGVVSASEVERRVTNGLHLAAARRRESVPSHLVPKPDLTDRRQRRREELQERSQGRFYVKPATKRNVGKVCSCMRCLTCKRAARLQQVIALGRKGDETCALLTFDFVALVSQRKAGGTYKDYLGNPVPFGELTREDKARAFNAATDAILDRTVASMGAWR